MGAGERGQTHQDYLLGITIFLFAVAFTFGYVPNIYDTYTDTVDGTMETQAERAGAHLVENFSVSAQSNVLKHNQTGGINETLSDEAGFRAFRSKAGLNTSTDRRGAPQVNVVITNATEMEREGPPAPIENGSATYSYGDHYDGQRVVASEIRVVRLANDGQDRCKPACYLLVRVW